MASLTIDRSKLLLTAMAALIAVAVSFAASGEATRAAALRQMAQRGLHHLSLVAGLQGAEQERLAGRPLAVMVAQEGGALWIQEAVGEAVDESRYFAQGDDTHNMLQAEVVESDDALALQLHLLRRGGWRVRTASALRVRILPWVPTLALALGAILALSVRRIGFGLLVAGVFAQVVLRLHAPDPETFAPRAWTTEIAEGPLLEGVVLFARDMTPLTTAIFGGILVFCLILVVFDHRRSQAREGSMGMTNAGMTALLGALGAVAWIEAATRASLMASLGTWQGVVIALGLAAAYLPALGAVRERWRA